MRVLSGLTVWEFDSIDAPTRTLTAKELWKSWQACPYSDKHEHSAERPCPDRIPHQNFASAWNLANHIVVCMGLSFDGTAGAFTHFVDWEVSQHFA